ncbi:ABC-2 type transport system ATP-binding protein [Prauserella shujinwangii]|uniref:ABC-2 type transport system ATP-binding protein n=1 Tax=Prauserella shujinwangii TaxID=1453103 RepID=A0A2T0M3S6_9PSEU|nr:ATP-binding cassette domain-containing protein [Prauserella shujinwangii]PRX51376.1 ABC-2 type transport system ATP-binding protein [Prauserella shujinwangii]
MTELMIEADRLTRVFGDVTALDTVTLTAPRGAVLGLLGHNGAGKTTLVNVLTTQVPPSSGTARVAGLDVRQGDQIRALIGLAGQFAAVDGQLSGLDNLITVARLLGAGRRAAYARAAELLDLFGLAGAARRPARTYSGGMRRRLDLAMSLVGHPEVIFLDEPTAGLDPESRLVLWRIVGRLARDGITVLLTTQYIEEADRLADAIVVLSGGRVVASGTPAELKAQVGTSSVRVTPVWPHGPARVLDCLSEAGFRAFAGPGARSVSTPVAEPGLVASVVRALDAAGIGVSELNVTEPTLNDVYLNLIKPEPVR